MQNQSAWIAQVGEYMATQSSTLGTWQSFGNGFWKMSLVYKQFPWKFSWGRNEEKPKRKKALLWWWSEQYIGYSPPFFFFFLFSFFLLEFSVLHNNQIPHACVEETSGRRFWSSSCIGIFSHLNGFVGEPWGWTCLRTPCCSAGTRTASLLSEEEEEEKKKDEMCVKRPHSHITDAQLRHIGLIALYKHFTALNGLLSLSTERTGSHRFRMRLQSMQLQINHKINVGLCFGPKQCIRRKQKTDSLF